MAKKYIDNYLTEWLQGNDVTVEFIPDYYYPRLMAASKQMMAGREDALSV